MKIFIVALFLAISEAVAPSPPSSPKLYTYTFDAKRVSHTIPASQPVLYMYYKVEPTQNATYYVEVNAATPFMIEYYLQNSKTGFETFGSDLNGCKPFTTGWDGVAEQIMIRGLMPAGACPVTPGNYWINQTVTGIIATLTEPADCGKYTLAANLDREGDWAIQADYEFIIKDYGTCNSSK